MVVNLLGIVTPRTQLRVQGLFKRYKTKKPYSIRARLASRGYLVLVAGLEPARCRHRGILSPLRLPIPPHQRITTIKIIA